MQDANNLDQARPNRSVIDNMHWASHPRLRIVSPNVPKVKAAEITRKPGAVLGHWTFRGMRQGDHRGHQQIRVAQPAGGTPTFGAGGKDIREIGLGQPR